MENLYEILGVPENATQDEIKKAYRSKAKEFHPDKGGDEELFKKISSAYDILSDENKRTHYDNQRRHGNIGHDFGGFGGFGGFEGFGGFGPDFFKQFFNQNNRQHSNTIIKGEDLSISLNISFEDSYFGTIKKIKYNRQEQCKDCGGNGSLMGNSFTTCSGCNGSGRKVRAAQTFAGITQVISACNDCGGKGKQIKEKCNSCSGNGNKSIEDIVDVQIPPGIKSGMQFEVHGKGNYSTGANIPGNLIVNINVASHDKFIRVHNDIHYDLFISIPEAILGSEDIKVPIVDGIVKIVLEPGTESGKTLRIQGKGMPFLNENRFGDFYVHVNVYVPKNLSEEDKKQIEKLKKKDIFKVPENHTQSGVFKKTNDFRNLFT